MLNNEQNIDEIIQKGLEQFNPTPPADVWSQIEQQIQTPTPASPQTDAGNSVLEIFKQMGIVSKIATIAALPILSATLYFALSQKQEPVSIENQISPIENQAIQNPISNPIEPSQNKVLDQKEKVKEKVSKEKSETTIPTIHLQELNKEGINPAVNANTYSDQLNQPKAEKPQNLTKDHSDKTKNTHEDNVPLIQHPKSGISESGNNTGMHAEPEFGNVFSPDGDGKNDTWEIQIEPTSYYHMRIFDSHGQLVFETEQAGNFWNGVNNKSGMDCESGMYTYIFDYQFDKSEKVKSKRGFINLLR